MKKPCKITFLYNCKYFLKKVYKNMQMIFQMPENSFDPRKNFGWSLAEPLKNNGWKKD